MGSSKRYSKARGPKRRYFRGTAKETTKNNGKDQASNEEDVVEKPTEETEENPAPKSASADKIEFSAASPEDCDSEDTFPECNFIMNSDLFLSLTATVARCPVCIAAVNIKHLPDKMGLAHFFELTCTDPNCEWKLKFCSSKECKKISESSGRNCFEVNKRAMIAFRENGLGHTGMSTFCRCMNIPPPMNIRTFEDLNSDIHNAYVKTAQESMSNAGKAVHESAKDREQEFANITVSGDGAWQKRGYSSLNGVMTLISKG